MAQFDVYSTSVENIISWIKSGEVAIPEIQRPLIRFIRKYEKKDVAGDRSGNEWSIHPQPDVRYQVYLEYLAELCKYMSKKYNKEYVWGDRTLKEDAEQTKP